MTALHLVRPVDHRAAEPCRAGCGHPRGYHAAGGRNGYCPSCYKRWLDNGLRGDAPPAPRHAPGGHGIRAGRLEDYLELRSWGLSRAEAAIRLGVCRRTIRRYETVLRAAA